MRVLFLIGFPGAGKTTLGRALEDTGSAAFVDLDEAVERRASMSVAEIFASQGEEAFRTMELDELRRICETSGHTERPLVVACGGGTPCRPEAMTLMLGSGDVVWLQSPAELLLKRLLEAGDTRPMIAGLDTEGVRAYIERVGRERHAAYSRATHTFDSSLLDTAEGIDRSVKLFISRFSL